MWIDTHAHLNIPEFEAGIEETLAAAAAAGVGRIIVIGIDAATSKRAVELAAEYEPIYAAVGIQPNHVAEASAEDWSAVLELASAAKVVALGETGLDRYWDRAPFELQREYFRMHMQAAVERKLPIVIHCRDAQADVIDEVARFRAGVAPVAGVMHSYTGDLAGVSACIDLGLYVSFAGMATYKKSDELRRAAAAVPLGRLLVETDSPYLSPEPVRGRRNQPAHVVHTGAALAKTLGLTVAAIEKTTTENALRLFRLPGPNHAMGGLPSR